jgi:hypothetical protein
MPDPAAASPPAGPDNKGLLVGLEQKKKSLTEKKDRLAKEKEVPGHDLVASKARVDRELREVDAEIARLKK